jgi:RND family efflux transporter MFP subunit
MANDTLRAGVLLCSLLLWALPVFPVQEATGGKEGTPSVTVSAAPVLELELPALVEATGTVQATERAAIAAKVTGVITRMPLVLGSAVKAGDLLVAISADEIAARMNLAEAQLAQAKRNLDREQNLLSKNAATAETARSMADQYAIAQAGCREAKTMGGYTTITAPFDGVVTRKNVSAGDLATPGTVLLQLESDRSLQIRSAVPESLVLGMHPGDVLTVQVEAAGMTIQGTVAEVAPAADPHSRTSQVVLNLPPGTTLRSGQFARVRLPKQGAKALFIPVIALVPFGQMDRVFVVADGRARLRLVRTGMRHDALVEILSGLHAGETVVTSNNRLLVDGQLLQVQP